MIDVAALLNRIADDIEANSGNPSDYILMRSIVNALRVGAKSVTPDEPEDDDALPADSAAVLRDAIEADENQDIRDGEGKDQHP